MNLNTCYYHPNLPASIVCNRCGRRICDSCRKPYSGLILCPLCYNTVPVAPSGVPLAPNAAPVSPPTGMPAPPPGTVAPTPIPVSSFGGIKPSGWYGPYVQGPKFAWLPSLLIISAAALIIANAASLISPSFAAWWNTIIPWNASLGSFSFILGIVLGLVLLGTVVMVYLKYKVLAAFVIFPTALVSIFIGGGFILGAILGVLAGILLIL